MGLNSPGSRANTQNSSIKPAVTPPVQTTKVATPAVKKDATPQPTPTPTPTEPQNQGEPTLLQSIMGGQDLFKGQRFGQLSSPDLLANRQGRTASLRPKSFGPLINLNASQNQYNTNNAVAPVNLSPDQQKAQTVLDSLPAGLNIDIYEAVMQAQLGDQAKAMRKQADELAQKRLDFLKKYDAASKIVNTPLEDNQEYMKAVQNRDEATIKRIIDERNAAAKIAPYGQGLENNRDYMKMLEDERNLRDGADQIDKIAPHLQDVLKTEVPGSPPIAVKGVIVPDDAKQPNLPLVLYLKPLSNGKWQLVDVTRPNNTHTYDGDTPGDALKNFMDNNDLPAGQVALQTPTAPPNYGQCLPGQMPTPDQLNKHSNGKSNWQDWRDGANKVGWGGVVLSVLAFLGGFVTDGATWAALPWLLGGTAIAFGAGSAFNIADRVTYGHFAWDFETFMDVVNIGLGAVDAGAAVKLGDELLNAKRVGDAVVYELAGQDGQITGRVIMDKEVAQQFNQLTNDLKNLEAKGAGTAEIDAKKQAIKDLEEQALRDGKLTFEGVTPKVQQQIAQLKSAGLSDDLIARSIKAGFTPDQLLNLTGRGFTKDTLDTALKAGYTSAQFETMAGLTNDTLAKTLKAGIKPEDLAGLFQAKLTDAAISKSIDSGFTIDQIKGLISQGAQGDKLAQALEKGLNPADIGNLSAKGVGGDTVVKAINEGMSVGDLKAVLDKGLSANAINKAVENGISPTNLKGILNQGVSASKVEGLINAGKSAAEINKEVLPDVLTYLRSQSSYLRGQNINLARIETNLNGLGADGEYLTQKLVSGEFAGKDGFQQILLDMQNVGKARDSVPVLKEAEALQQQGKNFGFELNGNGYDIDVYSIDANGNPDKVMQVKNTSINGNGGEYNTAEKAAKQLRSAPGIEKEVVLHVSNGSANSYTVDATALTRYQQRYPGIKLRIVFPDGTVRQLVP